MSDHFLSLDRKYRPDSFEEVKGQDHIIKTIQEDIRLNRLHPCIILHGAPGTGKTTSARLIAKTLNEHPSGTIEKDSASEGKIEHTRSLQSELQYMPMEGQYKTYIFDEAHRISAAAFDSLLKTLEEPPGYVKFILVTTDFTQIPATIKSRSQCFCFKPLERSFVKERLLEVCKLEGASLPENLIDLAVRYGLGSLRDSLIILEGIIARVEGGESVEEIIQLISGITHTELMNFTLGYLFQNFPLLEELSVKFADSNIDLVKVIVELQKFVMDCRFSLLYPDRAYGFEVSEFRSKIQEATKGDKQLLLKFGDQLDILFDSTVNLVRNLVTPSNRKALLSRFVIELAKTWTK
jgi:DNA polymerase-3 subunit gamma/tau